MRAAAGEDAVPPFPWDAAMEAGFRLLRLSSVDFWAMTPRELAAACGRGMGTGGAMGRTGLEALMQAFPDRGQTKGMNDGGI